MRLIFVNPHTHNFGKMVSGIVLGRKSFLKYNYLIKYNLIRNHNIGFFVDGTRNSFSLSSSVFPKFFCYIELMIWMMANHINPFRVKIYTDVEKLNPQEDILFEFSRTIADCTDKNISSSPWAQFNGLTIVHFTHYFKDIKKLSSRINRVKNCIPVAENNLIHSDFFTSYFPNIKEVYHLPFSYSERFLANKSFQERNNKCLAIGSITQVPNPEFIEFFESPNNLHPMRNQIFNEAANYADQIDSYIQGYNKTDNARTIMPEDGYLRKIMKTYFPFFILEKFFPTPQISYFKFDIVEKLNNYRMFICPEEVVGLPSINFVEGIACKLA